MRSSVVTIAPDYFSSADMAGMAGELCVEKLTEFPGPFQVPKA